MKRISEIGDMGLQDSPTPPQSTSATEEPHANPPLVEIQFPHRAAARILPLLRRLNRDLRETYRFREATRARMILYEEWTPAIIERETSSLLSTSPHFDTDSMGQPIPIPTDAFVFSPLLDETVAHIKNVVRRNGASTDTTPEQFILSLEQRSVLGLEKVSCPSPEQRETDIILCRMGFFGQRHTLEEVSLRWSITRERVRQIELRISAKRVEHFIADSRIEPELASFLATNLFPLSTAAATIVTALFQEALSTNPEQASRDENFVVQPGFAKMVDYLIDYFLWNGLIRRRNDLTVFARWVISLLQDVVEQMYRSSRNGDAATQIAAFGGTNLGRALLENGRSRLHNYTAESGVSVGDPRDSLWVWKLVLSTLNAPIEKPSAEIAKAIKQLKTRGVIEIVNPRIREQVIVYLRHDAVALVEVGKWVVRTDDTRNSLRDGLGRLLAIVGPLSTSHIRDAMESTKPGRTEYSLVFTDDELTAILLATKWCTFVENKWYWAGGLVQVGEKDQLIYNALSNLPRVFFYYEAVKATEGISSVANLNFFLKGPYGFSPKHNMYCLRGTDYNVFDLARPLPSGTVAHAKASSSFVSHDPDIMHVEAPANWNSQVALGLFYDGDWTIRHGSHTRPGKARKGVLFSGLSPVLKLKQLGLCFDLNINPETRVIRISKCASGASHATMPLAPSRKRAGMPPGSLSHKAGSLARPITKKSVKPPARKPQGPLLKARGSLARQATKIRPPTSARPPVKATAKAKASPRVLPIPPRTPVKSQEAARAQQEE
jgi:hypothetical protein